RRESFASRCTNGGPPGGRWGLRASTASAVRSRAGAHRRARAPGRTPAGGPRFFSRSLAVMGRQAPRERRAHLFAVIEKMTREGPQGETGAPGGRIAHLCSIGLAVARKLLSLARTQALGARRRGLARPDPAAGAQAPSRRLSAHHAKAQGRRPRRQRQARTQAHAGGQSLELAQAPVRCAHDGEPPSLPDRAQSRARARSHRPRPAVGRRHHPRVKPEDRLYVRLAETFVYLAVVTPRPK